MTKRGGNRRAQGTDDGDVGELLDQWTSEGEKGETILRLQHPYEWGGETVDSLKIRPMRARDMRGIPADGGTISVGTFLGVAETCCGMVAKEIDQLAPADVMRLVAVLAQDFAGGPQPGGK